MFDESRQHDIKRKDSTGQFVLLNADYSIILLTVTVTVQWTVTFTRMSRHAVWCGVLRGVVMCFVVVR